MQLRLFAGVVGACLLSAAAADASTFDEKAGTLKLEQGLLLAQSFDAADLGLPVRVFSVTHKQGYGVYTTSPDAIEIAPDAIEGKGALRVHGDRAVLIGDAASLASLAAGRVEVRFFAKADGAGPSLHVVYARKPLDDKTLSFPLGEVVAIRTGRVTSDGWVEYTSGAIDGNVLGATIAGFFLTPRADAPTGSGFLVDALEVKKIDGALLSGADCHIASEAKDCSKGSICMEGK